ncbi:MAG: hypothetical protein JWL82_163 [Parcubacteria group bacterium]|nr:hypothetical protein [Parcubacteria group bacterium]
MTWLRSKKTLVLTLVCLVVVALLGALVVAGMHARTMATTLRFEVVTDEAKQNLGLGNRAEIPDNYAMLFVFPEKARYGFWMKDMLVPIDITWLNDDGTILLVDHGVSPSTYPEVFYPPVPVKYVLETRAGYATAHNWEEGTKVALPAPYGI